MSGGGLLLTIAAVLALGYFGLHRKSAIRKTARVGAGIFFLIMLALTVALIYGSVTLSSKGGGVLFLFAMPAGFVAWIAGSMFFDSLRHEAYYDKSVPEKIDFNLAQHDSMIEELKASIARKERERGKFFTSGKRRAELRSQIDRETELLRELPKLLPALQDPRTYAGDES